MTLRIAFVALLMLTPLDGWAADGQAIAWVVDFEGAREGYRIQRQGASVPITFFMRLLEGDEIIVEKPGGKVRLVLENGRGLDVVRTRGAFVVRRGGAPATLTINFLDWAAGWFRTWSDEGSRPTSINIRGRAGRDLSAPLLAHPIPQVVAGRRQLFLAWQGGEGPYRVRVTRHDKSDPVVSIDRWEESWVKASGLDLEPGGYAVEVKDSTGKGASGRFEVVRGPAPQPHSLVHDTFGGDISPSPAYQTVLALWLATQGNGQWRLEAYQRASELAEIGYPPARLLRDGLERGQRPDPLPR